MQNLSKSEFHSGSSFLLLMLQWQCANIMWVHVQWLSLSFDTSFHGFFWARLLEWVATSFSRGSSRPRDRICVFYISCIKRWIFFFFTTEPHAAAAAKSLQSCRTLCDPIDGSPPGSSAPGTLQAQILEWVAISFSNA